VLVGVLLVAPGVGTVGVVAASAELRQATVTAPRTARVLRVIVKPGDVVAAGDTLVELDTALVDFDLAIARAELERTKAGALARELDLRGSDLDSAARLSQEGEAAVVALATLQSDEKRDRAELSQVEELLKKQESLVEQRLASAEQRDELKLREATLAQRCAEYPALVKAAADHEAATRDRQRTWRIAHEKDEKGGLPLQERVAPAVAEIAAQEERVHQLENLKGMYALKAPIAGAVQDVFVVVGDSVRQDAQVVNLVDDRPQRVIAWVEEKAARRVHIGDKVTLRPSDRQGGAREGLVQALAPGIEEMPVRFRAFPQQPAFGRAVYVALAPEDGVAPPLPGQAYDVVFEGTLFGLRR
ncbi:MAG TPA: HlyD family efflux transporter periplasmic adaptor subunit, partial [Myxococcota bacterium]